MNDADAEKELMDDFLMTDLVRKIEKKFPEHVATIIVCHPIDEQDVRFYGAGGVSKKDMRQLIGRLQKIYEILPDTAEDAERMHGYGF